MLVMQVFAIRDIITQRRWIGDGSRMERRQKLPRRTMKRVVLRVKKLIGIAATRHRRHRPQRIIRESSLVLALKSATHVTRVTKPQTKELGLNRSGHTNVNCTESCFDLQLQHDSHTAFNVQPGYSGSQTPTSAYENPRVPTSMYTILLVTNNDC